MQNHLFDHEWLLPNEGSDDPNRRTETVADIIVIATTSPSYRSFPGLGKWKKTVSVTLFIPAPNTKLLVGCTLVLSAWGGVYTAPFTRLENGRGVLAQIVGVPDQTNVVTFTILRT